MRPPHRILYLIDYYFGPSGGTERQLFELLCNLDRTKFHPHLAVFRSTPILKDNNIPCQTTVFNIHQFYKPISFIRLLKLTRFIRTAGFHLVHIFFNDAAMFAPLFCRLGGARVISSRRDMGIWYTPKNLSILRFSNKFVDRIVVNSQAIKHVVQQYERFTPDKIDLIVNGIDEKRYQTPPLPDFRSKYDIPPDAPIIGIVANIAPVKRHNDLFGAMPGLLHQFPNAVLVVVGGGGTMEVSAVTNLAQSLGITNHVRLVGSVKNPIAYVRYFDVAVNCSESEGLSNAILEYMACAKPVVCTDTGGNAELIRNEYNGFLVPVGDIAALSDRLVRFLSDQSLRQQMGANAFHTFSQGSYSISKMIESHMALYKSVMASGKKLP